MPDKAASPKEIEYPSLNLRHSSTSDYCHSLLQARTLPFWWYQDTSRGGKNFSLPFQDAQGAWWYQVRPGYAWPVDAIDPLSTPRSLPYSKSYLAYQHVVASGEASNSTLVINTVVDLPAYSPESIDDKRRNAIRKGVRSCDVVQVERIEDAWLPGVAKAWNDLVDRTGWKHHRDGGMIRESWSKLLEIPAATMLLAIDRASGQVAGFLITKIYGQTAYVDTIASNSDLLKSNPNDVLMYTFIRNAQKCSGVTKVHYAIKSSVEHLEKFKTSLGFAHHPFPATLRARPGLLTALRILRPQLYRRLMGQL